MKSVMSVMSLPCEDIRGNVDDFIAGFVGFVSASSMAKSCDTVC